MPLGALLEDMKSDRKDLFQFPARDLELLCQGSCGGPAKVDGSQKQCISICHLSRAMLSLSPNA